jgi:hypothetical protein
LLKFLIYLPFIFASFLIVACSSSGINKKKDEGKIVYDIEILGENLDAFMVSMMPSQAEFYFKKEKTAMFLSSKGNLVRFAAYSNGEEKIITQEIKLMNKKVKSDFNAREIFIYTDHPSFTIIETDFIDSIAGTYANVDLVIYDQINKKEAELLYSPEIKVTNPNWYNIYNDIPYVLLKYEYNQFGLKLRLKARSIEFMKVDKDIFISSDEYRQVSPEEFVDEVKVIAESL